MQRDAAHNTPTNQGSVQLKDEELVLIRHYFKTCI